MDQSGASSAAQSVRAPLKSSGGTMNAVALDRLRADILSCRLMPGERLRVETLRERYAMGISPIREALMRLEAEGLVELEHNKGFRVSPVSPKNLVDLMQTRMEIENIALRWSIEKGGVEWEASVLGTFHRLSHQPKIDPQNSYVVNEGWNKIHAEFHATLISACESPSLISIHARLFEQAERYVALSILSDATLRDDVSEHRKLMRATLSRDSKKACELNRNHIQRTLDKVASSLDAHEGFL